MALFASLLLPSLSVSANAEWVYEYENIRIAKEDDEDFKHDDAFASLNSFVILQCYSALLPHLPRAHLKARKDIEMNTTAPFGAHAISMISSL